MPPPVLPQGADVRPRWLHRPSRPPGAAHRRSSAAALGAHDDRLGGVALIADPLGARPAARCDGRRRHDRGAQAEDASVVGCHFSQVGTRSRIRRASRRSRGSAVRATCHTSSSTWHERYARAGKTAPAHRPTPHGQRRAELPADPAGRARRRRCGWDARCRRSTSAPASAAACAQAAINASPTLPRKSVDDEVLRPRPRPRWCGRGDERHESCEPLRHRIERPEHGHTRGVQRALGTRPLEPREVGIEQAVKLHELGEPVRWERDEHAHEQPAALHRSFEPGAAHPIQSPRRITRSTWPSGVRRTRSRPRRAPPASRRSAPAARSPPERRRQRHAGVLAPPAHGLVEQQRRRAAQRSSRVWGRPSGVPSMTSPRARTDPAAHPPRGSRR